MKKDFDAQGLVAAMSPAQVDQVAEAVAAAKNAPLIEQRIRVAKELTKAVKDTQPDSGKNTRQAHARVIGLRDQLNRLDIRIYTNQPT